MSHIRVLLVGTKYPRNVGMVSRILANFGLNHLFLISPQCRIDQEARQGAAQGQSPLESARIFSDWNSYYSAEPDSIRVAFSRRSGRKRSSEPLKTLLSSPLFEDSRPIDLIFGAEDHGLSRDDLDRAHRLTYFELPGPLKSMNLSHAVLYALQSFHSAGVGFQPTPLKEKEEVPDPEPFLKLWLESLNFELDSHPHWNQLTMLKQLIMKAAPTANEIHKLEMIVQQTIRKIRESSPTNL